MGWEARAGGAGGGAPGPTLRVGLQGKLRGPAGRAARGLPRRRRPQGSRLRPWPPLALEPEPHCARSGPARPDPRPRRLPGLRDVGSPDPRNFRLGVAGKRRGQQGPGAGAERACPQPTGEGSHRPPARPPRPRGAARAGPQSWHKTKVRVRGVGGEGERRRGKTHPPAARAPRVLPACGACGTQPPLPGSGGLAGHRAPRRSRRRRRSPDCSVSGAAAADTRAGRPQAPGGAPQSGAPILIKRINKRAPLAMCPHKWPSRRNAPAWKQSYFS